MKREIRENKKNQILERQTAKTQGNTSERNSKQIHNKGPITQFNKRREQTTNDHTMRQQKDKVVGTGMGQREARARITKANKK